MSAPARCAIEVEDLRVRRGGREVLHDVSLGIAAGRVTGLLGPSGSGKTTLLRAIVGVQVVESGAVRVLGEQAGARAVRAQIGYMTQSRGSTTTSACARTWPTSPASWARRQARVDAALATVQLEPLADQVVRTLSGGEQARASLATALVGHPAVLVLDEPTVGLDPAAAPAPLGHLPRARRRRRRAARLQPRHGRGRLLRRARPPPRGRQYSPAEPPTNSATGPTPTTSPRPSCA